MATRKFNRFGRTSGVFTCLSCGKKTRDVNGQNGQLQLCSLCQTKAECGNTLSDAGYDGDAWGVFAACESTAACESLLATKLKALEASQVTAAAEAALGVE
jgi:hypothetical protein